MDNDQMIEQLRTYLKNTYNSNNFYGRNIASSYYKEYEEITYSKYENQKQTIGLKIFKNKDSFIDHIVGISILLATIPAFNYGKGITLQAILMGFICFIILVYLTYVVFYKKKKIFLETYDNYFKIDGETILYYKEILITGIFTVKYKHGNEEYLILGMSDGEILKIKTEDTDITAKDFIKIIHLNRPDGADL